MHTTKIVLIDDHEVLRLGLRDFLATLPAYEIVGEAGTARAGLRVIDLAQPDVVLMDVALPGMDGVIATREILRRSRRTRVIILSAHAQIQDVMDAIDAGAAGYVLKADPLETLLHALDRAGRGVPYLSPTLAPGLAAFQALHLKGAALDILSEREREIFRLAADCRTSPEIARELCVARKTVDVHLTRINRKLGLHDRAALVRLAVGLGLVHSIRTTIPAPREDIHDSGTQGGHPRHALERAAGRAEIRRGAPWRLAGEGPRFKQSLCREVMS